MLTTHITQKTRMNQYIHISITKESYSNIIAGIIFDILNVIYSC